VSVVLTPLIIENFINGFLREDLADFVPTPPFHRDAWALVCQEWPNVAAAAPRGHAKSTGITFAYTLASLLFRCRKFPAIISNTNSKAVEFVRNIKMALRDNPKIKKTFRFKCFDKEAEDDFIAVFEDGYQCRVRAAGFGMSVRGFQWGSQRPDLVVGDDMEDDEQVLSPERRAKAQAWFYSALLPMVSRDGIFRIVGTIMHSDSLLQTFVDDTETWHSHVWEAHDDKFEHILWPDMFTREKLQRLQSTYIRNGMLDRYNMEYRNRAYDMSSGLFREEDFLEINDADRLALGQNSWQRVVGGDFAISVKQKRDYTVFIVAVVGPEFLYVVDVVKKRMDSEEIVTTMFEVEEAHRLRTHGEPLQWFEEDGAIRKALGYALELTMRKKGIFLALSPQNPGTTDKRTRSMAIRARCRAKAVKFDKESSWWPELRQELLEFDRGKHDDQVDALSWIGIGITSMGTPLTQDEENEEDYFEQSQSARAETGGRNSVTGY
jgi:predicted phage terminase large subunit-like protein